MVSRRLPQLRVNIHTQRPELGRGPALPWVSSQELSTLSQKLPGDPSHLMGQNWVTCPCPSQKETKGDGATCALLPTGVHPHLGGEGWARKRAWGRWAENQSLLPQASSLVTHPPRPPPPYKELSCRVRHSASLHARGTTCSKHKTRENPSFSNSVGLRLDKQSLALPVCI